MSTAIGIKRYSVYFFLLLIAGCGGGSSSEIDNLVANGDAVENWERGRFPAQDSLAGRCEAPRTNSNDRAGSAQFEKMWLRSWSNDFYLWYDEIPDQDPAPFTVAGYFDELVTRELSPSGQAKDNFHFSQDTEAYRQFSQSGVSSGYGLEYVIDQGNGNPRRIFVAYVEPGSPAADAGIVRGDEILSVDSTLVTTNTDPGIAALNAGLFPSEDGELHSFDLRNLNGSSQRSVQVISDSVVTIPVTNVQSFETNVGRVGYFLFNTHIATAEEGLVNAIATLAAANIDELVIDLRYNGGGRLAVASQLSYMVAGAQRTNGRTFERLQFNDKFPDTNPITGEASDPIPFYSRTIGLSLSSGQTLPSLNLDRVVVLATADTCSASESVINSLRGVGVEVILIGGTTCGKPYGFYPTDNCGTTYFTIQFRGVNEQNFGDYSDGFSPANTSGIPGVSLPGCDVDDDIRDTLGDENETMLSTALNYLETGACSTSQPKPQGLSKPSQLLPQDMRLYNVPEWKKIRTIEAN
jgi:C-terminal processing protease CtpA/Prc